MCFFPFSKEAFLVSIIIFRFRVFPWWSHRVSRRSRRSDGWRKDGRRVGASKNSPEKNGERFHQHLVVTDFFCHCFSDFFWKGATSPSDFCKNKNKNKQGFSTQVWRMSTNAGWKGQTSPYPLKESKKQEQHGHLRSKSTSLRLQGRCMGEWKVKLSFFCCGNTEQIFDVRKSFGKMIQASRELTYPYLDLPNMYVVLPSLLGFFLVKKSTNFTHKRKIQVYPHQTSGSRPGYVRVVWGLGA